MPSTQTATWRNCSFFWGLWSL